MFSAAQQKFRMYEYVALGGVLVAFVALVMLCGKKKQQMTAVNMNYTEEVPVTTGAAQQNFGGVSCAALRAAATHTTQTSSRSWSLTGRRSRCWSSSATANWARYGENRTP